MNDPQREAEQQLEERLASNFRAEDLSKADLRELTVMSHREQDIVRSLEASGQRLLIGPRGSGKSTYLRLAYFGALDGDRTLPVYVNYSKSISLEPSFRTTAQALPLFRQWILSQIVTGAAATLHDLNLRVPTLFDELVSEASAVVSAIERRRVDQAPDTRLDITGVIDYLERCGSIAGRKRVVLLLDDAAHAFASEQQREFFEIFGALRSRVVSSKAAVYPGVTSYTPRFHVGHDAQLIDVWIRPDEPQYLELMREIAQKRLGAEVFSELDRRESLIDYLAYASFGLPRTLVTMLAQVAENRKTASRTLVLADPAVTEAADNALKVFESLEAKLPRYKNFVRVGKQLVDACIEAIGDYNRSASSDDRAHRILLQEPLASEMQRVLGFLEYAGVVRQNSSSISNGPRSFRVVVPHWSLLLSRNALGLGRNPSAAAAVEAFSSNQHTVRVRRALPTLLGGDYLERCRLDLGACPNCGTERENPEARFCSSCGASLPQASVYEELLDTDVEMLPISDALVQRIHDDGRLNKVKDILLDEENEKLLNVKYIGAKRAHSIRSLAEEFVYE